MDLNNREIMAAAPDAIAIAMGHRRPGSHPLAESLADRPLSRLAMACGEVTRRSASEPDIAVMGRGLSTSDFSSALANGVAAVARRRFGKQAQHRSFCGEIEANDFRPTESVNVDVGLDLDTVGPLEEFGYGQASSYAGNDITIRTYGKVLRFSRPLIINDDIGAIRDVIANAGAAAARTEAKLVATALESNTAMADGGVPFHASYGNLIATAFSGTTLEQAMAALRMQKTPLDNRADFQAAHLVVAAEIEFSARKLIHEAGLQIAVTAMAELPNGHWYLTGDPEQVQTICVVKLRGSASPLLVEMHSAAAFDFDGSAVRLRTDLGAILVSRIGIIRGGV